MKNRFLLIITILLSLITTSCNKEDANTPKIETSTYKIAVIMPLTQGNTWKRTVNWALENFNQAQKTLNKRTEIIVEYKDENSSDLSEYLSKIASDDSYSAIVGPYSSENATKAATICDQTKKTLILPLATSTEFQRLFAEKEYVWNLAQSDIAQCEILLMQAVASERSTVSLITSNNDYGKTYSDWFAYQAIELGLGVNQIYIYKNNEELLDAINTIKQSHTYGHAVIFAPAKASDLEFLDSNINDSDLQTFPVIYCTDSAHSKELEGKIKNSFEGISPSADPTSGFINAYRLKFNEDPVAAEAHLFDAISILGYALATYSNTDLNNSIKKIVDGRDSWNRSWMWNDMGIALKLLQEGKQPDLNGTTGDWTFDRKYHISVLNSTYCHWTLSKGKYHTLEYLSTDGSGRTTSTTQIWQEQAKFFMDFNHMQEDFNYGDHNENWALIIGTSDTWAYYRHQADALAMYQILKEHGYKDDHIILIIEDNIAYNPQNIYPGIIKVTPNGENLYHNIEVDYKLSSIDISDLKEILLGNKSQRLPQVIPSGKKDNLFIFWSGHGSMGKLTWGSYHTVYGSEIYKILKEMNAQEKYRKMLFAMDACYSGSIAQECLGLPGILFVTSANSYEPAKADMRDPIMKIWLSNGFARAFQDAIDINPNITIRDLYYKLAKETVGSHAMMYNTENYGNVYNNTIREFIN